MLQNTRLGLGTIVRITLDHPESQVAREAMELAFAAMARVEELMSAYRPNSEVGVLNRMGCCDRVSADTLEVIGRALVYTKLTHGAFDVTVQPVLQNHEKSPQSDRSGGNVAPDLVGSKDIVIDGRLVRFKKQGMSINLGGIAKGYAVDRAVKSLRENGVTSAVVDAGGDIRVLGRRSDGKPWRIGVADPASVRRVTSIIWLTDMAVATSGTFRRRTRDIIDARTGRAADSILRATVVAPEAADADALATSVYILGPDEGMRLINSLDGVGALVLTREGDCIESEKWAGLTGSEEELCCTSI